MRRSLIVGLSLAALLIGFFFAGLYGIGRVTGVPAPKGGNRVGVVPVTGVILDSRETIGQIKEFVEDGSIPVLVVRVNSPGGGVGASQEIYRELEKVTKKKVVASMGGVAASGGYYVALGAEKIFANPGTVTGSIGVIMEFPNIEELMKKIGLKSYTIKSGERKDIGSPTRAMSPEDRAVLEGVVKDVHRQFVEVVAKRRKLPLEEVMKLADGRIFTGEQAKALGLVDALGNLEDAIREAARMAGIEGEPQVVFAKKRRFSLLELLIGERGIAFLESWLTGRYELSYLYRP